MGQAQQDQSRIDFKILKSQKESFQRAAHVGGYRTVTEFLVSSAQEKADSIFEKERMILQSERDKKLFFMTIMNPPAPNSKLKQAVKDYTVEFGM